MATTVVISVTIRQEVYINGTAMHIESKGYLEILNTLGISIYLISSEFLS